MAEVGYFPGMGFENGHTGGFGPIPFETFSVNLTLAAVGTASMSSVSNEFGIGPTPEPASFFLFGTGLLGMVGIFRRRKRIDETRNRRTTGTPTASVQA